MKKLKKQLPLSLIPIFALIILILIYPEISKKGASLGLVISGKIIIPSLFPFTVCVLFLMRSKFITYFNVLTPLTRFLFSIDGNMFSIMILSFLGGYPTGAKLLNEAVSLKKIKAKNAKFMLNYCVNAGPAFVVLAVGNGIAGSKSIGYLLLFSHIISSFLLALFFKFFMDTPSNKMNQEENILPFTENFVASVSNAATTVFGICCHVIFFSTIAEYVLHFEKSIPVLKYLSLILEVTTGVTSTKNILVISFLLGFAGISVWFQVFALADRFKINKLLFIVSRFFQGIISGLITAILLKITGISIYTSVINASFSLTYNGITLALSMLSMVLILLISIFSKKQGGKSIKDLL